MIMCAFAMSTSLYARELITFTVSIDDNSPVGNGQPKSPTDPPTVYIEDYTLTFENYHPAYVLVLKDENGIVVYTTVVNSTQTQVVLPSTLSGDYEIELIMGYWKFIGCVGL